MALSTNSQSEGFTSSGAFTEDNDARQHYHVIIVGAGFAGLCAAIKLREAGITDFVVLEKAGEVGGVWRDNTYPGCACDVPSSLYSYSFEANPNWSRVFAEQPEIKNYLQNTAQRYDVLRDVRLNHEVYQSNWNPEAARWDLDTSSGAYSGSFVVMACGPMHAPITPDIPGLESFTGTIFHSARWNHQYDLTDKRVAVIGSGASAVQFVPEIQAKVKELTVFQRTAHWVLPKFDQRLPNLVQKLFARMPLLLRLLRAFVYGIFEILNGGFHFPRMMKQFQRLAVFNIHRAIKDPELRKLLTPDYVIGCKRILQSNDWYPALNRPNVSVVGSPVCKINGNIVTAADGSSREVDAIILGTGFEITAPPIARCIRGLSGIPVADLWAGSPEGFKGTLVADCPNAFLMFGPNLAINSSAFIIIEAQVNYIVDALKKARANNIATISVNPAKTAEFNDRVQEALQETVWNKGGCTSYFIDKNGRNSTAWPWTTFKLKEQFVAFDLNEVDLEFKTGVAVAPLVTDLAEEAVVG